MVAALWRKLGIQSRRSSSQRGREYQVSEAAEADRVRCLSKGGEENREGNLRLGTMVSECFCPGSGGISSLRCALVSLHQWRI